MSLNEKPYIGGQAVIEGVMMRSPSFVSIAVRRPNGSIALREGPLAERWKSRLRRFPGVRGIAALIESLSLGSRALFFSAEQQENEDEQTHQSGGFRTAAAFAALIAILLFVVLPQGLARLLSTTLGWELDVVEWDYHLLIGSLKLLVFSTYLVIVSQRSEMRRVFQYHGAEHKTINAYERGLPLTVDCVRQQTTMHPRCGTTFIVMVVFIGVVLGTVSTQLLVDPRSWWPELKTVVVRILLLPLTAAVAFEFQRFTARFCTRGVLRVLLYPGFLFQKITTREPDDAQIEIALTAMQAAKTRERSGERCLSSETTRVFGSFARFRAEYSAAFYPSIRPALES